jgi:hypothetical protein
MVMSMKVTLAAARCPGCSIPNRFGHLFRQARRHCLNAATASRPTPGAETIVGYTPKGERVMPSVRTHRYTLAPNQVEKFLAQRAELIGQWRAAGLDLVETRLYRLEDGIYLDIWRWRSAEVMAKAFDTMGELPLVGATLRMTSEHSAVDGDLVDER